MVRGCRVTGVHFLNDAVDTAGVREKIDLLGEALARWQGRMTIRIVPFGALQRAIVAAVPADHRMLVYRRTMLRLADLVGNRGNGGSVPERYFTREEFVRLAKQQRLVITALDSGLDLYDHLPGMGTLLRPDWQFIAVLRH